MNNSGKFLGGLLLGTTVGVLAGLLLAPSPGNQTRRNLMRKSKSYSRQAVAAVRSYIENIKEGKVKDPSLSAKESEQFLDNLTEGS